MTSYFYNVDMPDVYGQGLGEKGNKKKRNSNKDSTQVMNYELSWYMFAM